MSIIHWHWCNDSKSTKNQKAFPLCGRGWLRLFSNQPTISLEWNLFNARSPHIEFSFGGGQVGTFITIPFLLTFVAHLYLPIFIGRARVFKVYLFEGMLCWAFNAGPDDWMDSTNKRGIKGRLDITRTLLGKVNYSSEIIETQNVLIPMPEKSYSAKMELRRDTWKRSRWFAHRTLRVHYDVNEAIPHPGKGENSYDCGDDGIYGGCVPAESIAEAVGKIVTLTYEYRIKRGGYSSIMWQPSENTAVK